MPRWQVVLAIEHEKWVVWCRRRECLSVFDPGPVFCTLVNSPIFDVPRSATTAGAELRALF